MKTARIIAAHDLSGIGRASLGAAIPIISSMGSVVCSLPTAVLSTITGVFDGYVMTDLTAQMRGAIEHWTALGEKFDYLYSGFLGSPGQVELIIEAADRFDGCRLVVDPVFADNWRLYPTMNAEMVTEMKRLASRAEMITPNVTEAAFLLDEMSGEHPPIDENILKQWLARLAGLGPRRVVITGCCIGGQMTVATYDKRADEYQRLKCDYAPIEFHGTGDIFTSVLVGALARGDGFGTAVTLAADFVRAAIDATPVEKESDKRYGVLIEKILNMLQDAAENRCERF